MAIQLKPDKTGESAAISQPVPLAQPKPAAASGFFSRFVKPASSTEVMFFTSQLSLMLEIGTPVTMALQTIAGEIQNEVFKAIVMDIRQDIEGGRQLSEAMKAHSRIFNEQYTSMVKAGEAGGFLNKILDRIVESQEKRFALIAQLKAALTYPAILCVFGLLVVVFVMVGVLPKFAAFFQGKESLLPWTTRLLMNVSMSLKHYWWGYILAVAGLVPGLIFWGGSARGRALRDRFLISGPLVSRMTNKIYTCEFLRTLGHLLESQVPLLEALKVARPTIWNQYYRQFVDAIRDNVDRGGRFSQPFSAYPYIPQTVKQMMVVGEEAGELAFVMLRLARFYDMEIEQELKKLAARIEPVALIVMGGVVGVIVSSIILPVFRLSQALR